MIIEKFKPIIIEFTGKACFFELIMKLLVNKDGSKVTQKSCSEVKKIMYDKFSKYFKKEDKKIIDEAVWIRNKLVHFEFSEIFKKQGSIQSVVVEETIDPKDSSNIPEAMKKMSEGKSYSVNEKSSFFGLCLEFNLNYKRIQELKVILDKATEIVTCVVAQSAGIAQNK